MSKELNRKARSQVWTSLELSAVCSKIQDGTHFSPHKSRQFLNGIYPYVTAKNVRPHGLDLADVTFLSESDHKDIYRRCDAAHGDVLLVKDGVNAGDTAINTYEGEISLLSSVCMLRPKPEIMLNTFLRYYLLSPAGNSQLTGEMSGTAIKRIILRKVRDLRVPVTSVDLQRRIVAKIDELFLDLDAGVAALKRVQANLKRYRAAVLKSAVEGKLTAQWRAPDSVPLGELITDLGQGWSPRCDLTREPLPDEWAIIKTTAVQSMHYLDNEAKPLPHAISPRPELEIKHGDFLMTRKGPRIRAGVTCLVRSTRNRLMVCDTVYRFRCKTSIVEPEYLELVLNSPRVLLDIDARKAGINDSGVSLTHYKISSLPIPLPPQDVQRAIIADVSAAVSVAETMEQLLRSQLTRSTRLCQAILKHAFEGKLVPQDPADEPVDIQGNGPPQGGGAPESNSKGSTARGRSRRA
jgi:type I restriction enzyme S subunit